MVEPHEEPSRAEWKVLKIVWDAGECAARDVVREAEATHDWSTSTVKTLLRRLVDKGHLSTQRVGNSFLYRPTGTALGALCDAADQLLDQAHEGTVGALLAHMVERSELSDEELGELRALLERKGRRGGRQRRGR